MAYLKTGREIVIGGVICYEFKCDKCDRTKFCSDILDHTNDRCVICELLRWRGKKNVSSNGTSNP